MNRLTERKICYPSCDKKGNLTRVDYIEIKNKALAQEKLCQLEDIEEKLGIELKVYHQLMSMLYCGEPNILYVKDKDTIVQVGILEIDYCKKKIIFYKDSSYNDDYVYGFAQYSKTWALTKEDLVHKEKEKC